MPDVGVISDKISMKIYRYLGVVLVSTLWVSNLQATKPCPPSPCMDEHAQFDLKKCRSVSDWIAVGTISHIKHKKEGPPTNKDFAEFTLDVIKWEKGGENLGKKLRFKVGWCYNQDELPSNTAGLFKFYGTYQLEPINDSLQYYYFEQLK